MRWCLPIAVLLSLMAAPALAQRAGDLVSAEAMPGAPAGMQAWRITYGTTDQDGRTIRATGVVAAPRGAAPGRARPVIAWAHGTWGVAERCAPSLSANFFTATPGLDAMVARGYVVVAADYPGLGSPGMNGYLFGRETAHSVLDALRAARSIPQAAAGNRFAVWGESQGGHAALWTSAEAQRYAPELSLVATAAAAPPTDLAANLRSGSDLNARAMLTAFALHSWAERTGAPLSALFKPGIAGVVTRLAQNNCVELSKKPRLGTILGISALRGAMRGKDIGAIRPWSTIAQDNSIDPRRVAGPLMIVQSQADTIVAPAVTRDFARRYCRLGHPLRYLRLASGDHGATTRASATETLDWIDARFAGQRESDDCRGI